MPWEKLYGRKKFYSKYASTFYFFLHPLILFSKSSRLMHLKLKLFLKPKQNQKP